MSFRKIAFMAFFAGFAPIVADAMIAYTPSRPCGCYQCSQPQVVEPKTVGGAYIALNLGMNLLSWENEYKSDYYGSRLEFSKDSYSFESLLGGSVAIGTRFGSEFRGDIEFGMSAKFSDEDDIATYTMSVPYLMVNAYYDFESGFYLGGGIGIAKSKSTLEMRLPYGISNIEGSSVSPKVGIALGYAAQVSDNTWIDFRYRLSGMKGVDISGVFLWDEYDDGDNKEYTLQVEGDLMVENALSVGIRYHF